MGIMLCQLPKLAAQLIKEPTRVKLFSKPDGDNQPRPKSSALSLRQFPPSSGCAGAGEAATVRRGAGRSAQSAPPRPVTAKGGPGVLATVSQPRAATGRPSSRDTSGQEVLAMAAPRDASFSAGVSFSVADSLPETEKNAGESENTYILRPIFQQRRVVDGLWRRRARLLGREGRAHLEAWASGRSARAPGQWGGAGLEREGRAGGGGAGLEREGGEGAGLG